MLTTNAIDIISAIIMSVNVISNANMYMNIDNTANEAINVTIIAICIETIDVTINAIVDAAINTISQ